MEFFNEMESSEQLIFILISFAISSVILYAIIRAGVRDGNISAYKKIEQYKKYISHRHLLKKKRRLLNNEYLNIELLCFLFRL